MEECPKEKDCARDQPAKSGVDERLVAPATLVVLFGVVVVLILIAVAVHYRY